MMRSKGINKIGIDHSCLKDTNSYEIAKNGRITGINIVMSQGIQIDENEGAIINNEKITNNI